MRFSGTRLLRVFYTIEGVLFLAYSTWRLWIKPLEFYRAPPVLEFMSRIFIGLMFVAGIFYVSRALGIMKGLFRSRSSDVIACVLSIPLWFLPALTAIGNAHTYLTSPYLPVELRPTGFYYLYVGILFIVIGCFNILSLYLSIRLLRATPNAQT